MQHGILYKQPGHYVIGPVSCLLPDGRLAVLALVSPFAGHYGLDRRIVLLSTDQGETFAENETCLVNPCLWMQSSSGWGTQEKGKQGVWQRRIFPPSRSACIVVSSRKGSA
jgi:hypothetical protein